MAIKKELIQFTIINDTDCSFNLPLFQQNVYSINATTKYSWNITTIDLSCGTGTIVINGVTTTINFQPNLTSFLAALNALGFGFFCTETTGGSTFLYVVDDTNVYGGLDVCTPITTTTTTSTTTAAPTTTTTTSTTTEAPTTTTTTSTTTEAPTTTTTTSTTTEAPTTTTTTSTTTEAPTTTTTTSTTTEAPTTTTTTSTTTEAPTTTTTTSTTTIAPSCLCYTITNNTGGTANYTYTPCGSGTPTVVAILDATTDNVCSETLPTSVSGLIIAACTDVTTCVNNTDCFGCTAATTTTTTSTTTEAPTTTTTTSTTTEAPTTTTTTTSTTEAPTTTTTTSTTTAAPLASNLLFDASTGAGGYEIGGIDVNAVTPTLIAGGGVPFSTGTHDYLTNELGSAETLNINITAFSLNGCITVTDALGNVQSQNITGTGIYSFTNLNIDLVTAVTILCADGTC